MSGACDTTKAVEPQNVGCGILSVSPRKKTGLERQTLYGSGLLFGTLRQCAGGRSLVALGTPDLVCRSNEVLI